MRFESFDGWLHPPREIALARDEVHAWRADLNVSADVLGELGAWLSADERERAARFRFERDRRRFVVARAALRSILGGYLRAYPADLVFQYGPSGKPALASTDLRFNVSHSSDRALYAVSHGRDLGIDLERVSPGRADAAIAERFFAPAERAALRALPPTARAEGFFACWTRKEAYVKARASGLALGLDRFTVTVDPRAAATFVSADDADEIARWSLTALHAWPGFMAALVVEGTGWRLKRWTWPAANRRSYFFPR
jgi:4'-phosphopantetheinyl transferase